jgi:hypothetical protein
MLNCSHCGKSTTMANWYMFRRIIRMINFFSSFTFFSISVSISISDVFFSLSKSANWIILGSSTTTGASGLTYTIACELETAVANANADMGSLAFVTNAKVRGKARTTLKTAGATNSVMLWEAMQALYPCEVTNNVPATLGTGNKSACIFGAFDQLLIGLWSGQEIVVDPYSRSLYGEVQIVCFQEADVNARHEAAFSAAQDLVTT